jgi:hypothetical protein
MSMYDTMLGAMFMFALMGVLISYEDDNLVTGILFALVCLLSVLTWATGGAA